MDEINDGDDKRTGVTPSVAAAAVVVTEAAATATDRDTANTTSTPAKTKNAEIATAETNKTATTTTDNIKKKTASLLSLKRKRPTADWEGTLDEPFPGGVDGREMEIYGHGNPDEDDERTKNRIKS